MMKTVKFKNKKIKSKNKIIITIILSVFMCLIFTKKISESMNDKILLAAQKLVKNENNKILKVAFTKKNELNIDPNELLTIIKNSKEEILGVDFKLDKCEQMMFAILGYFNENSANYDTNGYIMYIPLGYLTNTPLLTNLGPKIPVNIVLTDIAMGNVKTKITEFGINNAMVEIYVEINLILNIALPLQKEEERYTYEALIASKIITGKVPEFYNGAINSQSKTINLPMNE